MSNCIFKNDILLLTIILGIDIINIEIQVKYSTLKGVKI